MMKQHAEQRPFIGQGAAAVVTAVKAKPFIGQGTAAVVKSGGKKR